MIFPAYFDSKNSLSLYGYKNDFNFLKNLYIEERLPKILMFSGKKGTGKSTLINHFMFFIYDKKNYDENNLKLLKKSAFYIQFVNDIFPNIIYLSGSNFKNIKVDDIRDLKKKIFQSTISNEPRFIILDDVELFNVNSLNGLLKIIEEPSQKNYFLLINNQTKPLLDTIKSRSLEIKIFLNEYNRKKIIDSLIKNLDIELNFNLQNLNLTPGNFLKFNYLFKEYNISLEGDFIKNLTLLLNIYKKNKDIMFIDMILFLADYYFNILKSDSNISKEKLIEYKKFVFKNINNFFSYNLNQNALINAINNKIYNE